MNKDILHYLPIAKAIAALLHPYAEVVLHDLKDQKVVAIVNNFSKRKVGEDSLLEEDAHFKEFPDYFEPYYKINWDGRKLKSTTATLRDKAGKPIGLLCINLDISKFSELQHLLSLFTTEGLKNTLPKELFNDDWRETISLFVHEHLQKEGKIMEALSKNEKKELVRKLYEEGAFKTKNAAEHIGHVLHISRATVYKYLAEIEK